MAPFTATTFSTATCSPKTMPETSSATQIGCSGSTCSQIICTHYWILTNVRLQTQCGVTKLEKQSIIFHKVVLATKTKRIWLCHTSQTVSKKSGVNTHGTVAKEFGLTMITMLKLVVKHGKKNTEELHMGAVSCGFCFVNWRTKLQTLRTLKFVRIYVVHIVIDRYI